MSVVRRIDPYVKSAMLAAACVAIAAVPASAKLTNHRIALGQAVGAVRIGMTRAQVHHILGHPSGGKTLEVYAKLGLTVGFFHTSNAVTVGTRNAAYTTAKGIGPYRSTLAEVLAAYPGAHCDTSNMICDLVGPTRHVTRFTFNSSGELLAVGVALSKYVSALH